MKNKKIIVTGGAGFIGSHIVEELARFGSNIIVIDNEFTGKESNLNNAKKIAKEKKSTIRYHKMDICDYENINKIFKELSYDSPIDVIFHEAAIASVPRSIDDPKSSFENNVIGTLNLLLFSRDYKTKRFLFASSSSVYGNNEKIPAKEEEIGKTLSPYALTKFIGEEMLRQFYDLYGLETVSLRYFNVFGPRQNPNGPYAAAIPLFIEKILNNKSPIIFGNGLQSRDFTPVKNVVEGNILFSKLPKEKVAGKVFNLAGGNKIVLLDLINQINTSLNKNIKPEFLDKRIGDIVDSCADITKAKNLGFNPKMKFLEGLKETVEYYQEHLKRNI